jgi:hypothetical protein
MTRRPLGGSTRTSHRGSRRTRCRDRRRARLLRPPGSASSSLGSGASDGPTSPRKAEAASAPGPNPTLAFVAHLSTKRHLVRTHPARPCSFSRAYNRTIPPKAPPARRSRGGAAARLPLTAAVLLPRSGSPGDSGLAGAAGCSQTVLSTAFRETRERLVRYNRLARPQSSASPTGVCNF